MVVRKAKKVTKYRGSKTHGGGSMKKRRGAGHRGGRGNAGSGKRGDCKKPSYWAKKNENKGFSGRGFVAETINVGHLNSMIETLVTKGKAIEKGGVYTIDLAILKVDKLLGSGLVTKKLIITVDEATEKAVQKIEAAGGKVNFATVEITE